MARLLRGPAAPLHGVQDLFWLPHRLFPLGGPYADLVDKGAGVVYQTGMGGIQRPDG